MIKRRIPLIVVSLFAATLLVACGEQSEEAVPTVTRVAVEGAPATYTTAPSPTSAPEVASPAGSPGAEGETPSTGGDAAATEAKVVAKDILFEPTELTIAADTDVVVTLTNEGAAPHNFAVDALGISEDLAPGETKTVTINAPAGDYDYYCNVPGHKEAGMVGVLHVVAGGAASTEASAAPAKPTAAEGTAAVTEASSATSLTILAKDILFEPADASIPADTDVTVTLTNEGAAPHNFAIDALGISEDLAPGETKTVTINAPAGDYDYYCNVPGHKEAGMVGVMHVVAGGAAAPAEESAAPAEPTAASAEAAPTEGLTPVSADSIAAAAAAQAAATPEPAATASEEVAVVEASPEASPVAERVTILAKDILFEPKEATISANTDVVLVLKNEGAAPHNFAIDALKIDVDLAPGETREITVNAPAGDYDYYCNVPGHKEAGMVGVLHVVEKPAAAGEAAGVTVVAKDILFEPNEITIAPDTDVTFTLTNEGAAPHNFAIDALKIDVDLAPGETKTVTVNAPAGEYDFYCNVPGHKEAGMVGKLVVK